MTGYDALGISKSDFRKFAKDGKLSFRDGEYLSEKSGSILYVKDNIQYDIDRLPKSVQTDIMLKIKQIYLFETNNKLRNRY